MLLMPVQMLANCCRIYPSHLLPILTFLLFFEAVMAASNFVLAAEHDDRLASRPNPNILFILADDLGWSDTTLYGKTDYYRTPNLQRLADEGMTFSRAYSASPLCSPTRASILTGLHPARIGLTSPTCHLKQVILKASPGKPNRLNIPSAPNQSVTRLDTRYETLAETLKRAGYATGHFGKWHLGHEPYSPLEHGFDTDVPHWPGPGPAGSYVAPWAFTDFDPDTPKEHIEDRMANEAIEFLKRNKDRPFFLNYWMFSVHAPFDAKQNLIQKYRSRLDPKYKQRSPTYAAMVESMDDAVGSLMSALDELGLRENTIVVFFSDNGGNMYNRVDGVPATNNFPLRGGKATMFEGGIKVPCTVSFPGSIQPGTKSDRLIQSTDFFPTLLDLVGIRKDFAQPFDGYSFANELLRKPNSGENNSTPAPNDRALFTYFPHQPKVPDWIPPSLSVHFHDWKLIRIFFGGRNGRHRHLLFHLKNDPGESRDVSSAHPEIVEQLSKKMDEFLRSTDAIIPARNSNFEFETYDITKEGKSELKPTSRNPGRGKRKATSKKPSRNFLPGKWIPSQDCAISIKKGTLLISATGNDPYLSYRLPKELPAGSYELALTMASDTGNHGQVFWEEKGVAPRFIRQRSKVFTMESNAKSNTYRISFRSPNPVLSIRIDPGNLMGQVKIRRIELKSEKGSTFDLLENLKK